jgi:hypothetical protein
MDLEKVLGFPADIKYEDKALVQVAPAHESLRNYFEYDEELPIQVITRVSPVYRNEFGIFGYVEFSRLQFGPGQEIPRHLLKDVPEEYLSEDDTLKPGNVIHIDALLGIHEVPESTIKNLETGNRKQRKRAQSFVHDFKIKYNSPENISKPQFEGIPFEEENYYVTFRPNSRTIEYENKEEFADIVKLDFAIVLKYLFRMQEWLTYAHSEDWKKKKLEYSSISTDMIKKGSPLLLE